jgi:hypothetical protein
MTRLLYTYVIPSAIRLAVLSTTIGIVYAFADLFARGWTEIQRALHNGRLQAGAR